MEYSAILHDMDKRFCYAIDKDLFVIRVQVKKDDIKEIILHYEDKYIPLEWKDTRKTIPMKKVATSQFHDYYEAQLQMHLICLRYYFEFTDMQGEKVYYGNYEYSRECITNRDRMFDCPQNLREEEMFEVPEWAANKVVYQIFPSRFAASQPIDKELWYKAPITSKDNLHGDLRGIIDHLDHIQKLGIDVVYLTPIFKSDSCHKYDTTDYYQIDPSFGTTEDLKELVQKAHECGIKVVMDAVFNHTGRDFFAFKDIIEKEDKSRYLDWYFIERFPLKGEKGEAPNFKCFGYYDGMPKLNLKNPEVEKFVTDVACYWIKECDIDGWRMDVGDEISHFFWKRFRKAVKAVKKDLLIIGEIWHYAGDFLEGDEWDTVMNYDAFMEPLTWFLTGMEKHSDEYREDLLGNSEAFIGAMKTHMRALHMSALQTAMNELSNHDHSRFLTRTNHRVGRISYAGPEAASEGVNPAVMREAVTIQMTWPGAPTVYYGDEAGLCGFTDPDNRRTYPWGREDYQMIDFHRVMIRIHKKYEVLKTGSLGFLWNDYQGLCYARFSHDEQIIVIVNNQEEGREVEIRLEQAGISRLEDTKLKRVVMTSAVGFTEECKEYTAAAGILKITMPAFGAVVLHHKN